MVEFAREDVKTLASDIAPLLRRNWDEIHRDVPQYKLAPNLDVYCELEDRGCLYLFTARDAGVLIGYAVVAIAPRPHAIDELIGAIDALYVLPEHRSNGVAFKLLTFMQDQLKAVGVNTLAAGSRDPRIIRWMRTSCGFHYAETLLEKAL